ncbi:MAG TPA: DMT family transporter [Spirochaetota bacterium]|nr:DMT family transporter [Spirochaetota bacterium]HOK93151.1 DMT family transporter [Spirochaetota bacterium]HPP95818.1 DMT family transporter [Spirochaetota bacterium]
MISGVAIAFIAQFFIALSLVIDKIFFNDTEGKGVITYVFWISILSCFGFVLVFFGFEIPSAKGLLWSMVAACSFFAMLLSYYKVISIGEVTEAVPVVGGFAPLATFFISMVFYPKSMNEAEIIGFSLLVVAGFILFFADIKNIKIVLPWTLLAAFFIGLTNISEKYAFDNTANFVTAFVLMKGFTFVLGLSMLLFPSLKKEIFSRSQGTKKKWRVLYFVNRAIAGTGSFLIFYAIKLEKHPSIIEAVNGSRYIIVFVLAFILSRFLPALISESFKGFRFVLKFLATLLIFIALAGLGLQRHYESIADISYSDVQWGVTFSELMTEQLKIPTDDTLIAIIKELKPSGIRLVAYWDRIEKDIGHYDFKNLDRQMNICRSYNVPVILAIGQRVPRWPECHIPLWADSKKDLLRYLKEVVERYKSYSNLKYWQLENEPYLLFGECPPTDENLIKKELELVKSLDKEHQIIMTDGGEFGDWYRASSLADVFGTTLYRKVYNRFFGEIIYPLTPEFYMLKKDIVTFLSGKKNQEFIIIELGAEPWTYRQIYEMTVEEQIDSFTIDDFKENINYALKTKFTTCYLWGCEWWFYLKTKGYSQHWDFACEIFSKGKSAPKR